MSVKRLPSSYKLGQTLLPGKYAIDQSQLRSLIEYGVCPCGEHRIVSAPMFKPILDEETGRNKVVRSGRIYTCASMENEKSYKDMRCHFTIEGTSAKTPYLYVKWQE